MGPSDAGVSRLPLSMICIDDTAIMLRYSLNWATGSAVVPHY